jgi:hypothetical protein
MIQVRKPLADELHGTHSLPWEADIAARWSATPRLLVEHEWSLPSSHRFLSWVRWIQSTSFHPVSQRSILVFSSHLQVGLRNGYSLYAYLPEIFTHFSCPVCALCGWVRRAFINFAFPQNFCHLGPCPLFLLFRGAFSPGSCLMHSLPSHS